MAKEQSPNDPDLLVDEELLNLDEFPEELPDLLNLSDAEDERGAEEPPLLSNAESGKEAEEKEEEDEEALPVSRAAEEAEPAHPEEQKNPQMRMVGWVFKKAPGMEPEIRVVEAPAAVPEEQPDAAEEAETAESGADETEPKKAAEVGRGPSGEEDEDVFPLEWAWDKAGERSAAARRDDPEMWAAADAEEYSEQPKPTWSGVFRRMLARHRKKRRTSAADAPEDAEDRAEDPTQTDAEAFVDAVQAGDPDAEQDEPYTEEEPEPQKKRAPLFHAVPKPDISPRQLAVLYGNRLKSRRRNLIISLVLLVLLVYLNLTDSLNLPVPQFLWDDALLSAAMLEVLGLIVLLLGSSFVSGLSDLLHGRPGLHTLVSIAVVLTAADGFVLILLGREGPLPCVSGAALTLICSAFGQYLNQKAQRISCRTAAMTDHPGRVSLLVEEGQTTDLLLKYAGDTRGFGSQIQGTNGVQRRTGPLSLLVMLFAVLFMIMASVGQDEPEMVFWCGSVIFLLAAPLSATLAYGLPWCGVSERLNRVGCALAGWDGVRTLKDAHIVSLTDDDFFPTGMISCNGIQFYGKSQTTLAVGYAATLAKAAGGGLTDTFDKLVFSQGARYWLPQLYEFRMHDEGGYSGVINGSDVLLGTEDFMRLMNIPVPDGISVKTAAFCAIDGELAAQFALVYKMPGYVKPAIEALQRGGYQLVLASCDVNLSVRMLLQSFGLPVKDVQFPEAEIRQELSAAPDETGSVLGAILAREGLDGHCDAVLSAGLLYKVAKQNARWLGTASVLGLILGTYLASARAYTALQPLNVLIYMLLWLVPCLLNSYKATRF